MFVIPPQVTMLYYVNSGGMHVQDSNMLSALIGRGYSGAPEYRNNSDYEREIAKGPIPRGLWRIGSAFQHKRLGPDCIPLTPVKLEAGEPFHERSGFYIHGDNGKGDGSASSGCIVLDRRTRRSIIALGAQHLFVE